MAMAAQQQGEGEPPDGALLTRAQAGDPEAFRMLFLRHAPSVRRFAGDLLRNPAAADEATQEAFVRAHARLGALGEESKLRSWLLGIVRLVAFEQLRRDRREVELLDAGDEPSPAGATPPSPEALVLGAEAERVLGAALERLSPARRAALALRLEQGLGYDDIALAMGWPLQKVKNEIHRARLQLREALAPYLEGAA